LLDKTLQKEETVPTARLIIKKKKSKAEEFVQKEVTNLKEKYEFGEFLGSGAYGEVYKC
jgi:serine/threonine protein kinase